MAMYQNWANVVAENLAQSLTKAWDQEAGTIDLGNGLSISLDSLTNGSLDIGEIDGALASMLDPAYQGILAALQSFLVSGALVITADGENIKAEIKVDDIGQTARKPGGGGGGGGGKSAAQKLIEELKHQKELSDHRLKMLQFQETKYENAGQWLNLNAMLGEENNLRRTIITESEQAIERLKQQMASTAQGSDDWYSLRDSILSYEESIEECNNAIAENTKKMRENWQTARKTRIDLEGTVEQEIQARIERYRSMVEGTVSMQDIILDAIRQRYQDEWELLSKDIEKKKEALEEEKNLIEERLNKRKEAEDEAEKYEELAELRRQYALISMDSTRTKDAATLREKIEELEKDLAWKIAENESQAQQDAIQDQIDAYGEYQSSTEEDLNVLLEDANNFADEANTVLKMKQEDLFAWLKANVKDYANSLDAAQTSLLLSWEDTYKQMYGITDTWWTEINAILSSETSFIEYMKQSEDYKNASEMDKQYMVVEWEDMYRAYLEAFKEGATYFHDDNWLLTSGTGAGGSGSGGGNHNADEGTSEESEFLNKDYKDFKDKTFSDMFKDMFVVYAENSRYSNDSLQTMEALPTKNNNNDTTGIIDQKRLKKNASGGLVDYTGLTWVDGTFSKPEAFLSADDTALMRDMLDAAKYIKLNPFISNIDSASFSGKGFSVGDVNITITEAQFKDDADYEQVAERVGQAFLKELNKQGMNMANYSF